MTDDELVIPFDPPDTDLTYEHYLETCRRAAGVLQAGARLGRGMDGCARGQLVVGTEDALALSVAKPVEAHGH